jgi:hypothetical protein
MRHSNKNFKTLITLKLRNSNLLILKLLGIRIQTACKYNATILAYHFEDTHTWKHSLTLSFSYTGKHIY